MFDPVHKLADAEITGWRTAYAQWVADNPWGQQLKTELAAVDDGHGDNLERAKQELEEF